MMAKSREGCCANWPKPCSYHEGWLDAEDLLEDRLRAAEAVCRALELGVLRTVREGRLDPQDEACGGLVESLSAWRALTELGEPADA
jgi:hypothetical protein